MRKDDQNDNCRHSFPNGVGRLHEAQGSSAMFGAPRLGDERGAAAPFAPHAQTEQKAKGRELRYGMGKTTSRAGNGINEDGTHQSAGWGSGVARCHLVLPPLGRSLWVRGAIDAFRDALNEKR